MNLMEKIQLAQAFVSIIEDANKELKKARLDGHVTVGELVAIVTTVSRQAVHAAGLANTVVFTTTKRGSRKETNVP